MFMIVILLRVIGNLVIIALLSLPLVILKALFCVVLNHGSVFLHRFTYSYWKRTIH